MPVETSPQAESAFLHPASQILIWLAFAFSVPWLRPVELIMITGSLSLLLMLRHPYQYLKVIRRSRWLLISLMLVYGFATPGELEIPAFGTYGPTREGLLAGGMQVLRLIAVLASLTLLLVSTSRDRTLAGLYVLLLPFKCLGLDVDRFAARTWLTLNYVDNAEHAEPKHIERWRDSLQGAMRCTDNETRTIRLETGSFFCVDYVAVACAGLVMVLLLARGLP